MNTMQARTRTRTAAALATLILTASISPAAPPAITPTGGTDTNITDIQTAAPFATIVVDEPDGDPVSVTITYPPERGTLSGAGLSGPPGNHTIASQTNTAVQAILRGLIFTPVPNRIDIQATLPEQTPFALVVVDDETPPKSAINPNFKVSVTPVNDPPVAVPDSFPIAEDDLVDEVPSAMDPPTPDPNEGIQIIRDPLANDTDVDTNDVKVLLVVGATTNSRGLDITATRSTNNILWNFSEVDINLLTNGESLSITTEYAVIDFRGASNNGLATVTITGQNDPVSVLGPDSQTFSVESGRELSPFNNFAILDVDDGESITATVTADKVAGPSGVGPGTLRRIGDASGSASVTLSGIASDVEAELVTLVYTAPADDLQGDRLEVTLTLSVSDSTSTHSNKVTTVFVSSPTVIAGAQSNQSMTDKETLRPFSTVSLTSAGQLRLTIIPSIPAAGVLLGSFSFDPANHVYTKNGTDLELTSALRQLVLDPTENRAGNPTSVTFTLLLETSGGSLVDSNAASLVTIQSANDTPSISGTIIGLIRINSDVNPLPAPFETVLVTDVDDGGAQLVSVEVQMTDPTVGLLIPPGGGTGTNRFVLNNRAPVEITTNLNQLTFRPTPGNTPVGTEQTVQLIIRVTDAAGDTRVDANTTLQVRVVNGAPMLAIPPDQPRLFDPAQVVVPFRDVTVSDDQDLQLIIRLSNPTNGTLRVPTNSAGGYTLINLGGGEYQIPFTAATNINAAFQELIFEPPPGVPEFPDTTFFLEVTDNINVVNGQLAIAAGLKPQTHIVTSGADDGPGSLRQAVLDANDGDHIVFLFDQPFGQSLQINVGAAILIQKDLTIHGPGARNLVLDGGNSGRIFRVAGDVVLRGMTLTRGKADTSGGAIKVDPGGSLELTECAFTQNTANTWGGAVDVEGDHFVARRCLFAHNATDSSLGRGGGAVALYASEASVIENCTFSDNLQASASGRGGGALFLENSDTTHRFNIFISHCTFKNNSDVAGLGSSIRSTAFDTMAWLKNCLFNDGEGRNLHAGGSGRLVSLGGNLSDDDTRTIFTQGGIPSAVTLLDHPSDQRSVSLDEWIAPLADQGGPTLVHPLVESGSGGNNPAIDASVAHSVDSPAVLAAAAALGGGLSLADLMALAIAIEPATDQRGYWRDWQNQAPPLADPVYLVDSGAYEAGARDSIAINEISFRQPAEDSAEFVEIVNGRTSQTLSFTGFSLLVGTRIQHRFLPASVAPGLGLVVRASTNVSVVGALTQTAAWTNSISTNTLGINHEGDSIVVLNALGQTVAEARFLGAYRTSGPVATNYLNDITSVALSPTIGGAYLPHRLANQVELMRLTGTPISTDGPTIDGLPGNTPGSDVLGAPLDGSNAPPIAVDDLIDVPEDGVSLLDLLANDIELDGTDTLRIAQLLPGDLPAGPFATLGDISIHPDSTTGAAVLYNPDNAPEIQALPAGTSRYDYFSYRVIDDPGFGGTNYSGQTLTNTIALVTLRIVGANDIPRLPPYLFMTTEDQPLRILADPDYLTNAFDFGDPADSPASLAPAAIFAAAADFDADSDDDNKSLLLSAVSAPGVAMDSQDASTLSAFSRCGARVTVDLRFDRRETHILYDPTDSEILNRLAPGNVVEDQFAYYATDQHGALGVNIITIAVIGTNDEPKASDDGPFVTTEDLAALLDGSSLLLNDLDPDTNTHPDTPPSGVADALEIFQVGVTSAFNARITLDYLAQTVTYDPSTSASLRALARDERAHVPDLDDALDTFTYRVRENRASGDKGMSEATVSVHVVGVNDTPIPVTDTNQTLETTPLVETRADRRVFSNDIEYDIDGHAPDDVLRAAILDSHITLLGGVATVAADGSYTYDPSRSAYFNGLAQGATATDSFPYTVIDSSLTIANDDVFSVFTDTTNVTLDVLANDRNLPLPTQPLRIIAVSDPDQNGTVSTNATATALVYTPLTTFVGIETFTYQISDGLGATDTATVRVKATVNPLNGNLTANDDRFTIGAGVQVSLPVLANDNVLPADASTLTITGSPPPGQTNQNLLLGNDSPVEVGPDGKSLLFTADGSQTGARVLFYEISAGGEARDIAAVTLLVPDRSFKLVANNDCFVVPESPVESTLDVLANDDLLPGLGLNTVIESIGPTNALDTYTTPGGSVITISSNRTELLFLPGPGITSESVSYTLSDGIGGGGIATVDVIVTNNIFSATDDHFTVYKNSPAVTLNVLPNDVVIPSGGETIRITGIGLDGQAPTNGIASITPDGLGIVYTPNTSAFDRDLFSYEIAYGTLARAEALVAVEIIDRDCIVVGIDTLCSLDPNPDRFSVEESSANNVLNVLINDLILPPNGASIRIQSLDSSSAQGGQLSIGPGQQSVLYTPAAGFIGEDSFSYWVTDGLGGIGKAQVTVQVGDLPTNPDHFSALAESTDVLLDVLANDQILPGTAEDFVLIEAYHMPNPSTGARVVGKTTLGGDLYIINNAILYDAPYNIPPIDHPPNSDHNTRVAIDSFTYEVEDDTQGRFQGTATITLYENGSDRADGEVVIIVVGVNDPPFITGTVSGQTVYHRSSIRPFAGAAVFDVDDHGAQPLAVTVTINQPDQGVLTSLGGFADLGGGVYRIGNTNAGVSPAAASAALRQLVFQPTTDDRLTLPVASETTTFTITAEDGWAPAVSDSGTSVSALHPFRGNIAPASLSSADEAGTAVAASRDLVVIGAPFGLNNGVRAGVAYLYQRQNDNFDSWIEIKKFVPTDSPSSDRFGQSVAVSGDTVVVGAMADVHLGQRSGTAYVFQRHHGGTDNWGLAAKLFPADGASDDQFGHAVAIHADTIVVGAHFKDSAGGNSGAAYIHERDTGGTDNWGFVKRLIASDAGGGDEFGFSVAIHADTIVAGAPFEDASGANAGAAYLFERHHGGPDNWGERVKLLAPDAGSGDQFGSAVALFGPTAVVGAPAQDQNGSDAGAVYLFNRNQGGPENWGHLTNLLAGSAAPLDALGTAVAIDATTVIAGAPSSDALAPNAGAAHLFQLNDTTGQWVELEPLVPDNPAASTDFGSAVALRDFTAVVGARLDDDRGANAGSAYIYRLKYNNPPRVALPVPDQLAIQFMPFAYLVPPGTFLDPDLDDTLLLFAEQADPPGPLPAWLNFSTASELFAGTPPDPALIEIALTAADNLGATVTDRFNLEVWSASGGFSHTNGPGIIPQLALYDDPGHGQIRILFDRLRIDSGLSYSLECSHDLRFWGSIDTWIVQETVTMLDIASEQVTWIIDRDRFIDPVLFFRVRIAP